MVAALRAGIWGAAGNCQDAAACYQGPQHRPAIEAGTCAIAPHGLCGTKPGTLLKNQIAIRHRTLDITRPGFVEADTVAHCGNTLAGDFVWSLTLTDILSGRTENRATWNNDAIGVMTQMEDIEAKLPFSHPWL